MPVQPKTTTTATKPILFLNLTHIRLSSMPPANLPETTTRDWNATVLCRINHRTSTAYFHRLTVNIGIHGCGAVHPPNEHKR